MDNHGALESSLWELNAQYQELWEYVEFLIQSWDQESNKVPNKALKKRLDSSRKELRALESQISETESLLGCGGGGDTAMTPSDIGPNIIMESETVEILGEGDTQTEGATQESTAPSPGREEEQPMASPVTRTEDDLLTGAAAAAATEVETELASLQVTSSPEGEDDHQEASS